MPRLHWIAVACSVLLIPAGHARAQQPDTNQPQSQAQPPDDGPPPTLRHLPRGGQPDQAQTPQTQSPQSRPDNKPQPSQQPRQSAAPSQTPSSDATPAQPVTLPAANAPNLTEDSKLQLIRYVDGEYVKVTTPLPGGKDGFRIKAGAPLDQNALHQALTFGGVALNVGDSVQITKVEFHDRDIQVELNNGAKGKHSWRDHIEVMGSGPFNTSTTTTPENMPAVQAKPGATLILEFDRPIPDMTGDQLKAYFSKVLDFSKRSAAVQYADSLPPKMREAIAEKRAEVGMDHDMVTAAMGRPERKVREKDAEGNDTEDWIYGIPPQKTIFVTFEGDKVVKVVEYP
jgi:hypothetical protein